VHESGLGSIPSRAWYVSGDKTLVGGNIQIR
jgi:hypothetical protein